MREGLRVQGMRVRVLNYYILLTPKYLYRDYFKAKVDTLFGYDMDL